MEVRCSGNKIRSGIIGSSWHPEGVLKAFRGVTT